jgi:hypothetical protein
LFWGKYVEDMAAGVAKHQAHKIPSFDASDFGKWYRDVGRVQFGLQNAFVQLGQTLHSFHKHVATAVAANRNRNQTGAEAAVAQVQADLTEAVKWFDALEIVRKETKVA